MIYLGPRSNSDQQKINKHDQSTMDGLMIMHTMITTTMINPQWTKTSWTIGGRTGKTRPERPRHGGQDTPPMLSRCAPCRSPYGLARRASTPIPDKGAAQHGGTQYQRTATQTPNHYRNGRGHQYPYAHPIPTRPSHRGIRIRTTTTAQSNTIPLNTHSLIHSLTHNAQRTTNQSTMNHQSISSNQQCNTHSNGEPIPITSLHM